MNQSIDNLLAALNRAKTADTVLDEIWTELGPYTPALSEPLRRKLQDYFNFDDSE